MTILGNALLVIATLLFLGLASMLLGKAPSGSGDSLMGFAWGMIILNLAFSICIILVYTLVAIKGGLEWAGSSSSQRFWRVTLLLLAALITSALAGLFKYEHGPVPGLLRVYSSFAPLVIPLVLIGAAGILLNDNLRTSVSPSLYKYPLYLAAIIGVTGSASALFGSIAQSMRNQKARVEAAANFEDENHLRILGEIDSCNVMTSMVNILVFTGDNQPEEIMQKAVAKVKTNPEWQQELIRLMGTDWAPEVFQFLASNPVDDPALFAQPLKEAIQIQARLIRESIQSSSHPSHFYAGRFGWEIERVIRTVDKFQGNGTDYLPDMKDLRAALDEPTDFEKVDFSCTPILDKWIKDHS